MNYVSVSRKHLCVLTKKEVVAKALYCAEVVRIVYVSKQHACAFNHVLLKCCASGSQIDCLASRFV